MEPPPPPPAAAPPLSAPAQQQQQQQQQPQPQSQHLSYPDSIDSSPRSRNTDSWDDTIPAGAGGRLRLMCSYGGHIIPRPHDKSLCYVGGETRIVVVDRNTSLTDLSARLSKTLLTGRSFTLKYQLPSEDLDSLISVTTDEDLDNMIDEYDRTVHGGGSGGGGGGGGGAAKPSRLRLFLFASKPESSQSIGPILDNPAKSEDWFFNALNGAAGMLNRGFSDSASVNCLLGLDDDVIGTVGGGGVGGGSGGGSLSNIDSGGSQPKNAKQGNNNIQDVHSVPDSPMLETTSSFGSTSSSPSLAHLPPIRVHVDEGVRALQDQKVGMIEEQFAQMNITGQAGFKPEESGGGGGGGGGFVVLSSPPPMPPAAILASAVPVSSDYVRVISDDERSDHGVPIGYRKPQQPGQPQTLPPPQSQQKSTAVFDLPSPDSVSSDSSFGNAINRPKPVIYHHQQQDPVVQIPTTTTRVASNPVVDPKMNISDPNPRLQLQQQQQNQDSGYVLQPQFEPIQQQQQQQQQPQQFIHHPGAHYIHHPPAGTVPISAYYPVYASQQQHHPHHHQQIDQQQYPIYYVPARQAQQPYNNLSVQQQQPNLSEASTGIIPSSHPQTHPNPAMVPPPGAGYNPVRNAAQMGKPEIATGVYRTATTVAPPSLVQVPSAQHHQHQQHQQHQQQQQQQQQYVGYSQIHHHPSQSVAPSSAANYAYEYADPGHAAQIYYTQPLAPTMTSQYQTMTGTAAVMPEVSGQLPADNMKQQMRTSQPL